MIIKEMRVKNYRSIKDATLALGNMTALVGRNGSGKSNFLNAIELFFNRAARPDEDDYHARDTESEIEIGLTFAALSDEEAKEYAPYVRGGELHVIRVFPHNQPGTFHGERMQHEGFKEIRDAKGRQDKRDMYSHLVEAGEYDLEPARSADDVEQNLQKWERANPKACELAKDDGQFFGATNVGGGLLTRHIERLLIPAVRDAKEDATDKGKSVIAQIVDLVVRAELEADREWHELQNQAKADYQRVVDRFASESVPELAESLTGDLQEFAPGNAVELRFTGSDAWNMPLPTGHVELVEDDFSASVERSGHGLQRAFIFTALQKLVELTKSATAETSAESSNDVSGSASGVTLLLAIEEPELYQHPARQRRIAQTLRRMSESARDGSIGRVQVIFTTHSPLFVSVDRCDEVRVIRKVATHGADTMDTRVSSADIDSMTTRLRTASASDRKFTSEGLRSRLHAVATPTVNEGFFAEVVVLVEGVTDRGVLRATAGLMGLDLDALNISVIPCGSKTNLDRPLLAFQELGIPTYTIWDGDECNGKDQHPETNELLTTLIGLEGKQSPTFVGERGACFQYDLESTLRVEYGGSVFADAKAEASAAYDLNGSAKNELVYESAIKLAQKQGGSSNSIKSIVNSIADLQHADTHTFEQVGDDGRSSV